MVSLLTKIGKIDVLNVLDMFGLDYLKNPVPQGCEDKRLEIDLEALRDSLWFDADGNPKDDWLENQHDKPRWIDTSAMICDPLTKAGTDKFHSRLVGVMES